MVDLPIRRRFFSHLLLALTAWWKKGHYNQSNRKRNCRRRNRKSKSFVHLSPCRDSTTVSKSVSVPETSSSPFNAHQPQEAVAAELLPTAAKGFTAMLSENTTTTQLGKSSSEEDDSETEQSQL